jgi:hypothetical protein
MKDFLIEVSLTALYIKKYIYIDTIVSTNIIKKNPHHKLVNLYHKRKIIDKYLPSLTELTSNIQ